MPNPIYVYLCEHRDATEIATSSFQSMLRHIDVLYYEFVSHDLEWTALVERNWNECIQKDDLSRVRYTHPIGMYLLRSLAGSGKKIQLERSLAPEEDFEKIRLEATMAFFDGLLENAPKAYARFLDDDLLYQEQRENRVTYDLMRMPESTGVVFGNGHLRLLHQVSRHRPVEQIFPYIPYPTSYEVLLRQDYARTGSLDRELLYRSILESMVLQAVGDDKSFSNREGVLVANYLAQTLSPRRIIQLRDQYLFKADTNRGISVAAVISPFLAEHGFPGPRELRERLSPKE